jgi:general secretion pathway protein G
MNTRPTYRTNARGFSLLELMLVLAIIGVLTAVAAWNLMGTSTNAKIKASYASMNMIRTALRTYYLSANAYPSSLQVLQTGPGALLSTDFKLADGWGQPFLYQTPGRNHEFDLISKGPDMAYPSADDLDVWNQPQAAGSNP